MLTRIAYPNKQTGVAVIYGLYSILKNKLEVVRHICQGFF